MLPIFICEDDPIQRKSLEQYINNYIVMENLGMKIVCSTDDPQAILDHLKRHPKTMGIYFLDVDLGHDLDGVQLGVRIRKIDAMGSIVFVTSHSGLATSFFKHKVEAFGYIVKESKPRQIQSEVIDCLQTIYERYAHTETSSEQFFKIKMAGKVYLLSIADILFFETSGVQRKIIVHAKEGELLFTGVMKEIEAFSSKFIHVHKSLIANRDHVRSLDSEEMAIYFSNGDKRPIPPKRMRDVKQLLEL